MNKMTRHYYEAKISVIWDNSTWLVSKDYEVARKEAIKLKKRHPQDDIRLRTSILDEIDEHITI